MAVRLEGKTYDVLEELEHGGALLDTIAGYVCQSGAGLEKLPDHIGHVLLRQRLIERNGRGGPGGGLKRYTITPEGRRALGLYWELNRAGVNPYEHYRGKRKAWRAEATHGAVNG